MTRAQPVVLARHDWSARRAAHQRRVTAWIKPYLARRQRGDKHPVEDFLFTYYSYRPSRLRRWHPGPGVVLADAAEYLDYGGYRAVDGGGGAALDTDAVLARRGEAARHIHTLLVRTAERPPHLGCFGMHEWAMVYRLPADAVRHADRPLRLSPEELAQIVEERGAACSHFDAYRFFTPPARSLNVLAPTRERQSELEQPGCLHANMDLYKWAYKLSPLVDSDLVADCFALARRIRALDMRASPYDLASLGYPPVRVETAAGRAEYAAAQRSFADAAEPLRRRLIAVCESLPGR
ncbi:MAG: 3-methyladenine DNA glycosylase [Micromonosporaceae bacterium]|nr:3-methyladenine DNA glycosylase [Micromonosporaceae bacterium]